MKPFLFFVLFLIVVSGCKKSTKCEKEIYLVPKGFHGPIIVYFDQPDGQKVQYEDSIRVYDIPASGFLKTQFPKNGGCMNNNRIHFYYVDSLGTREPLDYFLNLDKDSLPKDKNYVVFSLLSDKEAKPDFVIQLVGRFDEANDLIQSVKYLEPLKILDSI